MNRLRRMLFLFRGAGGVAPGRQATSGAPRRLGGRPFWGVDGVVIKSPSISGLISRFHFQYRRWPRRTQYLSIAHPSSLFVLAPGLLEKEPVPGFEDRSLWRPDVDVDAERALAQLQGLAQRIYSDVVAEPGMNQLPAFEIKDAIGRTRMVRLDLHCDGLPLQAVELDQVGERRFGKIPCECQTEILTQAQRAGRRSSPNPEPLFVLVSG